jgi:DNA end-binding protein Ku
VVAKLHEVKEFVKLEEIDQAHFNHPYFLPPDSDSGCHACLPALRDAIANTEQVAIGRVVLRSKEYLVAGRECDDLLSLTTMLFADENRESQEIEAVPGGSAGKPGRGEVARAVIEAITRDFDPSRYGACHRRRLMKINQEKRKTGEVGVPEIEAEPGPVPDLTAALWESLARVKQS